MSDENLEKMLEGNFPAEVLDGLGKCLVTGQARFNPGTNSGRFWPDAFDPRLEAMMLSPKPSALRHPQGSVYKLSSIALGDTPNMPQFFMFRHRLIGTLDALED